MLEESLELSGSLARADRLPSIIQKALARLNALPCSELQNLKPKERVTLSFLIRCTSYRSQSTPIKIRKNLLAEHVGVSERTLYRILTALCDLGIIRRHPQQIDRQGGAKVSDISWSESFAKLLFSVNQPARAPSPTPANTADPQAESNTDMTYSKGPEQPSNANLADACGYSPFYTKRQSPSESCQREVPADCAPLKGMLKESGIFSLMKIFSSNKKRLGDFVQTALPHIKAARNPYAYLCAIGLSKHSSGKAVANKPLSSVSESPRKELLPVIGSRVEHGTRQLECNDIGFIEVFENGCRIGSLPWTKALSMLPESVIKVLSRNPA